jgi:DNA repair exonuclease SbcCD ATPase subunit
MAKSNALNFRRSLISFAWTWIGLLIVIGIISLFSIWSMNRAYDLSSKQAQAIGIMNSDVSSAQVAFKIQVQEWKNILLRGRDGISRDKYYASFEKQEAKVQESLKGASEKCVNLGLQFDCQLLHEIVAQHQNLGANYREKLINSSLDNYDSIHKLDMSVKGADRDLDAHMEEVGKKLLALQSIERESTQKKLNDRYETLRKLILVVMSLALTITTFSLYTVLRTTRN